MEANTVGRTVPTYRMALEGVALRFSAFRRALRKGDRIAFDRLMERARAHASAASYEASLDPQELMLVSILLDQELEIGRLERVVEELSWAVMGRPAAAAGTLDASDGRKAESAREVQAGQDRGLGASGGWDFRFKEDRRRAARLPAPQETPGGSDPL